MQHPNQVCCRWSYTPQNQGQGLSKTVHRVTEGIGGILLVLSSMQVSASMLHTAAKCQRVLRLLVPEGKRRAQWGGAKSLGERTTTCSLMLSNKG